MFLPPPEIFTITSGTFRTAFRSFLGVMPAVLELLVAFIQAYVFTLLSALYIGMALEQHEPHAEKSH